MGFKIVNNNDTGSLNVGNLASRQFLPGEKIRILGEDKVRTITFVMGKGEKQHLCFKNQGKLNLGPVEFEVVTEE